MNIGLTGSIGCGKSTVLSLFEKLNVRVLSSDSIVETIYREDRQVLDTLAERYGLQILTSGGILDRKVLASIVFKDASELLWLEKFIHPKVGDYWQNQLKAFPEEHHVVEIPLLFEKKLENYFNFTVCVSVSCEVQLCRLETRGLSRQESKERIRNQMDLVEKERRADYVIFNNAGIFVTEQQVLRLAKVLRLHSYIYLKSPIVIIKTIIPNLS